MISQMHPMNGEAEGANAGRRTSLMLRLLLGLVAMLGASQAWAQTACFPEFANPATPTAVVYMGQTPTVQLALNPSNGDFVASTGGYDIASSDPTVLSPVQTFWQPTACNQTFNVPINLHQPGTASLLLCVAGSNCTNSIAEIVYTVNPLGGGVYVMTLEAGDDQTATSGSTLSPMEVLLEQDTAGCAGCPRVPVAGEEIIWDVSPPAASSTPSFSTFTDTNGRAQASITIAPTYVGPFTVTATMENDSSAQYTFSATATPSGNVYVLNYVSGDGQSAQGGQALPDPLVVELMNPVGNFPTPVAGATINWTVSPASAAYAPSFSTTTDASGRSEAYVTISGSFSGFFSVTAESADSPNATFTFEATATPRTYELSKPENSGDGAMIATGGSATLRALVTSNGEPVANRGVIWTVLDGQATPTQRTVNSDSFGVSSIDYTFGQTPGPVQIQAVLATDAGQIQNYTITVGSTPDGVSVDYVSGDGQTVTAGEKLSESLVVSVLRASEGGTAAPDAGATVVWTVSPSAASTIPISTSTVNSDGLASIEIVTSASFSGAFTIRAEHFDSPEAAYVFHATAISAASPLVLVKPGTDSGDGQTGLVGEALEQPLRVQVLQGGVGMGGVTVAWNISTGDASLDASTSVTDANGYASMNLTFGNEPGEVGVHASIQGVDGEGVFFGVTAEAPSAPDVVTMGIVSGDGQSAEAGATLPQPLVVSVLRSAAGGTSAPDVGATVSWTVSPPAASPTPALTSSVGSDGRASIQIAIAPGFIGAFTIRAEHGDDPGVAQVFHATAIDPAAGITLQIVSGDGQANPPGWPSEPLVVRAVDGAGHAVPGLTITWTATNATVTPASSVTDEQGLASTIAQISAPSTAQVTAHIQGQSASATFVLNGGLQGIAILSERERAYARAMDAMWPELQASTTLTPEQQDLAARCIELIQLANSGQTDVQNALRAMSQDTAPTQSNAAISSNAAQFDNITSRIAALRGGASGFSLGGLSMAMPNGGLLPLSFLPSAVLSKAAADATSANDPGFTRWGFFATGTIGRGKRDSYGENTGYDFDTAGLTAGFDYRVRDNLVLGFSLGYTKQDTDLAQGGGQVKTDGVSVSLYGSWYSEKSWYLDTVLTHGRNSYDMKRLINYVVQTSSGASAVHQLARADGDGTQTSLSISAGRDFQKGAWSISPYLRGSVTRIDFDGYEETMLANQPGSGLAMGVESRELDSRTLVLGSRFAYTMSRDWGILTPHMHVEWEHEFKDDPDQITAYFRYDPLRTPIQFEGEALDSNYANIGIGVSALFPRGRSAFLMYEKLLGAEHLSRDTISIGIRMEF